MFYPPHTNHSGSYKTLILFGFFPKSESVHPVCTLLPFTGTLISDQWVVVSG